MTPLDDIQFWSRQLSEHALFFSLGLEVEPFKSQAAALHSDWERARAALTGATDLPAAQAIVGKPTVDLTDWQRGVMAEQEKRWLGWLQPLFFAHTFRELEYFIARAWHGGWPAGVTLAQNLQFMREHAEFAAQLLDPTQTDLIQKAQASVAQFAGIEKDCCAALTSSLLDMSTQAGKALDEYLTGSPVADPSKGVIHPVLAEHVVREGKRFLQTLDELHPPAIETAHVHATEQPPPVPVPPVPPST